MRLLFCFLLLATLASAEVVRLKIHGAGIMPRELTEADLRDFPRESLTAIEPHDKTPHLYRGIAMRDLLQKAGLPLGEAMRGRVPQQLVVRIVATDGYAVVFALAEFDAAFSSRALLLADSIDNQPLPEKNGPLQLIAPGDSRGARWVRSVNAIEIISLASTP